MDKNYILYTNSKDQRRLAEIHSDLANGKVNQVIGYARYSVMLHGLHDDGDDGMPEMNGIYPIISGDMFNELYGKVLTLIDLAFPEGSQREAFKSVTRNELSNWYDKHVDYTRKMVEHAIKYPPEAVEQTDK